jgi:hypothetical protein
VASGRAFRPWLRLFLLATCIRRIGRHRTLGDAGNSRVVVRLCLALLHVASIFSSVFLVILSRNTLVPIEIEAIRVSLDGSDVGDSQTGNMGRHGVPT